MNHSLPTESRDILAYFRKSTGDNKYFDFYLLNIDLLMYSGRCVTYSNRILCNKSDSNDLFDMSSVVNARISWFDSLLLTAMWLLVFASSITSFGYLPSIIFLCLNVVLVFRRASNGLLVYLLVLFTPAISLGIPNFVNISVAIAMIGCIYANPSPKLFLPLRCRMFVAAFAYVCISSLSLFIAPDFGLATRYFIQNVNGLVALTVLLVLVKNREDLGRLLKLWAVLAGISLLISATHTILGNDASLFSIQGNVMDDVEIKTRVFIDNTYVKRLLWPGKGPNYWSAYLIFPLGVSLAFGDAVSTLIRKVFWISISGLISVSIIATFSRSGVLAVCLVLSLYLIIKKARAFLPILVILVSFGILITVNPKIVERIWGIPETIAGGAHHRFGQYAYAIKMFGESPIWGCGTGAYITRYVDEGLHNTFLLVTVETGIIGLITFALVIWLSVKNYFTFKYFYRLRGFRGGCDFVLTLLLGLAGMLAMISTVPFREFKLLWFECGTCLLLWSLTQRFGNEYEKPLFRP